MMLEVVEMICLYAILDLNSTWVINMVKFENMVDFENWMNKYDRLYKVKEVGFRKEKKGLGSLIGMRGAKYIYVPYKDNY